MLRCDASQVKYTASLVLALFGRCLRIVSVAIAAFDIVHALALAFAPCFASPFASPFASSSAPAPGCLCREYDLLGFVRLRTQSQGVFPLRLVEIRDSLRAGQGL
eukprot:scaffold3216_cov208-Pinguiococcus_pyrenoidosus.AAC.2